MSTRKTFLIGGLNLGIGQAICQASSFVKSLIIARLISPTNFGIAAIFAMTYSLLEMISNVSVQMLLVQAEDGDHPRFQSTVHLVQSLRGVMNAAIIFAIAGPVSRLFGAPQAKLAVQCLALAPLIRALNHMDLYRFQREVNFGPQVRVEAGSNLLVALLALPLALWFRNYWAMLWLLVAQAACYSIGSHLVAKRRYQWSWDRVYTNRVFEFGWPLLINGLLMYGIFEGDRFVIGSAHRLFASNSYTLADLGVYSVAFALAQAPALVAGNVCTSLFLPLLSSARKASSQFERRYIACLHILSLLGAVMAIVFVLTGGRLITLLYGEKYASARVFIGWLSAMWALRTVRMAPTLAAIAMGDTRNAMVSNLARSSALLGIIVLAAAGRDMVWIAVCGFVGELLALVVCVWRLQLRHGVPASSCFRPYGAFFAGIVIAAIVANSGATKLGLTGNVLVACALAAMQIVGMAYLFGTVRGEVRELLFRLQSTITGTKVAFDPEL